MKMVSMAAAQLKGKGTPSAWAITRALAQSSGGAARLPPMHTGGGALRIPGQNQLLRDIQRPAGRSPSCKRNREGGHAGQPARHLWLQDVNLGFRAETQAAKSMGDGFGAAETTPH